MNFMKDDEFLLLMVHCEDRAIGFENLHILTTAERETLYKVGIRTAHEQPAWCMIEPAQGQYNWAYLDNIIKRNRDAGLKSLLQISGWRVPKWIPNEWKARRSNGMFEDEQLSIWNEEAETYSDNYYRLLCERYKSPDIMFFFGEHQGGEGALPPTSCFYDDAALKEYKSFYGESAVPNIGGADTLNWLKGCVIAHFIRKQEILYPYYHEVWNEQQRLMDKWSKAYANYAQPEIMKAYRTLWPHGNIVLLQYTYFDTAHGKDEWDWVDNLVDATNCEVIVEAMFCAGLPTTTPKAIAKGFRGQIVHPANSSGEHLEGWMVDNIKISHERWMASRGL